MCGDFDAAALTEFPRICDEVKIGFSDVRMDSNVPGRVVNGIIAMTAILYSDLNASAITQFLRISDEVKIGISDMRVDPNVLRSEVNAGAITEFLKICGEVMRDLSDIIYYIHRGRAISDFFSR